MAETVVSGSMLGVEQKGEQLVATIVIDPEYTIKAKNIFLGNKSPVALVRLNEPDRPKPKAAGKGPYAKQAKELVKSGFFENPLLWRRLGSDAAYLEWLKSQVCAITGKPGNDNNQIIPAHVRRVSAGAGTGIKPEFSAIPLNNHHHQLQHQHGEVYVTPKSFYKIDSYLDYASKASIPYQDIQNPRYWWEWQASMWATRWAKGRFSDYLLERHNIPDTTYLSPALMVTIAIENDVWDLLPDCYKQGE